jgi:hypothetical protein
VKILPIISSALAAVAVSGALANAAHAGPTPPTVPADIQVEAGNKVFALGHATGVQIYACNGTAWTFVAPRANLFDDHGRFRISHFAGPTWQHLDGSSVVGELVNPAPVEGAIPWLLLSAKSTSRGAFGNRLAKTTYIQRINTRGGLAPAAETCNAATAGTQAEVPYTADYFFWRGLGVR